MCGQLVSVRNSRSDPLMAETSPVQRKLTVMWPVKLYHKRVYKHELRGSTFSFLNVRYYLELKFLYTKDGKYELVLRRADDGRSLKEVPFGVSVELKTRNNGVVILSAPRIRITSTPHTILTFWHTTVMNCHCPTVGENGVQYYATNIVCRLDVDLTSDVQLDGDVTNLSTQSSDSDFPPDLESLSLDFGNLLKNGTLPDAKLRCGDRVTPAHRSVLAARSEVFAAMFSNEMSESRTGTVNVEDLEEDVFDMFLQYLYSGKIAGVPDDVVPGLYAAADKYAVHSLKAACRRRMLDRLTEQNCVSVLTMADAHSDADFKREVVSFICGHDSIFVSDVWREFSEEASKLAMEVYQAFVQSKMKKL